MQAGAKFRTAPKPDADVIALLSGMLASAQAGYIRSVVLVAVNPVHQVETAAAGDLSDLRTTVLLGGLSRAAHELLNTGKP